MLHAGADMVRAGAVGAVVLGDKEKPDHTNMLNEGHAPHFAELGRDPNSGASVIYEMKVPCCPRRSYKRGVLRYTLCDQKKIGSLWRLYRRLPDTGLQEPFHLTSVHVTSPLYRVTGPGGWRAQGGQGSRADGGPFTCRGLTQGN